MESFDDEGRPTPLADNRVDFDVTGPARIAGTGNGNPLILRTEAGEAGDIRVRATS